MAVTVGHVCVYDTFSSCGGLVDNFTHTLVGIALAEATCRVRKQTGAARKAVFVAAIAGSNFPDLDLLMHFVDPTRIGYLLNHRGHSHTYLILLPQLLLILGAFALYGKLKKTPPPGADFISLGIAAALGLTAHLTMDFFNSYGTHIWAPFDMRWYSTDAIFIIEPWYWAALLPLALVLLKKMVSKLALAALPLSALVLAVSVGFVPLWMGVLAILVGAGLFFILKSDRTSARAWVPLTLAAVVTLGFHFGADRTRQLLRAQFDATLGFELLDISLSAMPANPFCWSYFTVEKSADTYRSSAGTVKYFGVQCPAWIMPGGIQLDPIARPTFKFNPQIQEIAEYSVPLATLRMEVKEHCRVKAWFQFARVPHVDGTTYNDLRFATRGKTNFTTYDSTEDAKDQCPPLDPGWTPWRADLLAE